MRPETLFVCFFPLISLLELFGQQMDFTCGFMFMLVYIPPTVLSTASEQVEKSRNNLNHIILICGKQLKQIENCLSPIIQHSKYEALIYFSAKFLFHHYFIVPMLSILISVCGLSKALLSVHHLAPTARNERK